LALTAKLVAEKRFEKWIEKLILPALRTVQAKLAFQARSKHFFLNPMLWLVKEEECAFCEGILCLPLS
jgi:hypothetical protein